MQNVNLWSDEQSLTQIHAYNSLLSFSILRTKIQCIQIKPCLKKKQKIISLRSKAADTVPISLAFKLIVAFNLYKKQIMRLGRPKSICNRILRLLLQEKQSCKSRIATKAKVFIPCKIQSVERFLFSSFKAAFIFVAIVTLLLKTILAQNL